MKVYNRRRKDRRMKDRRKKDKLFIEMTEEDFDKFMKDKEQEQKDGEQ